MAYAAPEQIQESMVINERADIYSLGIVLYQLLTGKLPFQGQTSFDFLMARLTDPPIPVLEANPDVPEVFVPILDKALAQHPDDRYKNMDEFSHALLEARYELSGSFTTQPPPAKKRRPATEEKTSIIDTEELNNLQDVKVRLKLPASGKEIATAGRAELVIGRAHKDSKPDIDLGPYGGSQAGVSRLHSKLVRQGDEWSVEDLGSINGTYVNGKKVDPHQKKKIKNGDVIRCGLIELQFHVDDARK
jgi:serine/threonine-protein kinase